MSEYCWTCFSSSCECDADINERFLARQIGRDEYRRLYQIERRNELFNRNRSSLLKTHFFKIGQELSRDRLPDYLQYRAESDAYRYHMDMRIADYGGSEYEREVERQASLYHTGYSFIVERAD